VRQKHPSRVRKSRIVPNQYDPSNAVALLGNRRRLHSLSNGAEFLGVSLKTLRRLIDAGELQVVRLRGRVLVDTNDLERLITESKAS
jgi:excisionase family DNA binding protein